jgi:hypothetical protein
VEYVLLLLEEDIMSLSVGSRTHRKEMGMLINFIIFLDKRDTYCDTDPCFVGGFLVGVCVCVWVVFVYMSQSRRSFF